MTVRALARQSCRKRKYSRDCLQINDLEEKLAKALECRSAELREERLTAFTVRRLLPTIFQDVMSIPCSMPILIYYILYFVLPLPFKGTCRSALEDSFEVPRDQLRAVACPCLAVSRRNGLNRPLSRQSQHCAQPRSSQRYIQIQQRAGLHCL